MKTMTRAQHYAHLARESLRRVKGEGPTPVGSPAPELKRMEPFDGDTTFVADSCFDCGYHQCSCGPVLDCYIECYRCLRRSSKTTIKAASYALDVMEITRRQAHVRAEEEALKAGWIFNDYGQHFCSGCAAVYQTFQAKTLKFQGQTFKPKHSLSLGEILHAQIEQNLKAKEGMKRMWGDCEPKSPNAKTCSQCKGSGLDPKKWSTILGPATCDLCHGSGESGPSGY